MNEKTRRMTLTAMLAAVAYMVMAVGRIPVVMFLKYDPKDVVIAIGAFLLGPLHGTLITLLVALVEMLTVSDTGIIGFFMNALSTLAFVVPAALIYHRRKDIRHAVAGLAVGVVAMTAMMLAWNYIVTPYYMGYPREAVAALLLPVFLPFNLFKGVLNAGITMLIYKPVTQALMHSRLIPERTKAAHPARRFNPGITAASAFAVITAVVCFVLLHYA